LPDILDVVVRDRKDLLAERFLWRGIRDRTWQREYLGSELMLKQLFRDSLRSRSRIEIDGFVTRLGARRFLLRPSPADLECHIICEGEGLRRLPADFEFVRVAGYRTILKSNGRFRIGDKVIRVESYESIRLPSDFVRPEITFREAANLLVEKHVDVIKPLKESLLLSIISSPKDLFRIGGLTTSLMPLTYTLAPSLARLLSDILKTIPKDLTSDRQLQMGVSGLGRIGVSPFSWGALTTSSREASRSRHAKLFSRTVSGSGFNEVTIGISSESIAPESLDEIWIRHSDFPIIVDHASERIGHVKELDLDLAKFFLTVHMNMPATSPSIGDDLLKLVKNPLSKMKRTYDPNGYGGLIDPDVQYGTPRDILHIAKALARAAGSDTVDLIHLHEAIDKFREVREATFDAWEDRDITYGFHTVDEKLGNLGKTSKKIYTYLMDNPNSSTSEIRENFSKISATIYDSSLQQLIQEGLVYRTSEIDDTYSVAI